MSIIRSADTGIALKINPYGEALVEGIVRTPFEHVIFHEKQGYNILSQVVALTSAAGKTAMLYVKNTSTALKMYVLDVEYSGNVVGEWEVLRNPTTGTLIDGATAALTPNLEFSTTNVPPALAYDGDDGETFTDGAIMDNFTLSAGTHEQNHNGGFILNTNDSIGFSVTPAANGRFSVTLTCWFDF